MERDGKGKAWSREMWHQAPDAHQHQPPASACGIYEEKGQKLRAHPPIGKHGKVTCSLRVQKPGMAKCSYARDVTPHFVGCRNHDSTLQKYLVRLTCWNFSSVPRMVIQIQIRQIAPANITHEDIFQKLTMQARKLSGCGNGFQNNG